jgi:hypothetical protein
MVHSIALLRIMPTCCQKMRNTLYLAVAIASCALPATGFCQSEFAKKRAAKLEGVADSLQQVRIDKVDKPVARVSEGRRYSKASELHLLFLPCATGTENDKKDGALMFGIQASGFTSVVDPRQKGKSVQDKGSDVVRVKVSIAGLFDENVKRPKAKIDLPSIKHGSTFPADMLARDEIQRRLEFAFPEIDIEGVKRLEQAHLQVENKAAEPITVWVQYRTRQRLEYRYQWQWVPGEPGSGERLELTLGPGQKQFVTDREGEKIEASRVRVWAESETGETWEENRRKDLWLVEENPKLDGARAYHAEAMRVHTHVFKPSGEKRPFSERIVEFKNKTPETLDLRLEYRSSRGGKIAWRSGRYTIAPGETLQPRDSDGLRIRASRIRFTAESENRRYVKHSGDSLFTVEEVDGRRLYEAKKIGLFVHTFEPAGDTREAVILADNTRIMRGTETLATARRDQQFQVTGAEGNWVKVKFTQNGEVKEGWVQRSQINLASAQPLGSPSTKLQTVQIRAPYTDVQLGTQRIARLNQGDQYEVLSRNGSWLRVQVRVQGRDVQGWVNAQHTAVVE